jgi:alanine-synthesizing transaminase
MIAALARIKSYLDYGVFQPIQIASIIALRECEEDTHRICALYQKRRNLLVDGLDKAGWPVEKPRGSMFVWAPIPVRFRSLGSLEFSKLLLQKALVAVSPGVGFGPLGEGSVRFALIENDHRTRQALRSIKQFLREGGPADEGDFSEPDTVLQKRTGRVPPPQTSKEPAVSAPAGAVRCAGVPEKST